MELAVALIGPSFLCRHILGDDAQLEALGLGDVLVRDALLLEVALQPIHEPDEEVRPIVLERQGIGEQRAGGGRAPSEHLADQEQIARRLALPHRWHAIAKERRLLHRLPQRGGGPARLVAIRGGNGVPQPLLGGVRPEAGELIEEGVRLFDPHLAQAFALVAELHARDAGLAVPAVALPDLLHPVFARDGDLLGLVVDAAGVRRPFAEVQRAAACGRSD